MSKNISRKEFMKLAGLTPLAYSLPNLLLKPNRPNPNPDAKNVIIVVFDTLSAFNIQLYGYERETMPNLNRLAERATVYHNHYSPGNFTTPGTASLLTGTYPWTHRAFVAGKPVADEFKTKNIFHSFDQYYRISYTHNPLVNTFLNQFNDDLELYKKRSELYLSNEDWITKIFKNDEDIATLSWIQGIKKSFGGEAYSLFLSSLYQKYANNIITGIEKDFPRGVPYISQDSYYILEDAIDWTMNEVSSLPQPFLGYFHYLPPHKPYATRKDFFNTFRDDGYLSVEKPPHPLKSGGYFQISIEKLRRWYDEFILYADHEFNRLYTHLEESGILENTWLILTSDHGELFERGYVSHMVPFLFEPLVKIPLIIFEPGQNKRRDIYDRTSSVDVLPTLLHLTGQSPPDWVEGEILPPYRQEPVTPDRAIFAFESKKNQQFEPTPQGTAAMHKGPFKIKYYYGYSQLNNGPIYDLYNLEEDPQELNNLYQSNKNFANQLAEELIAALEKAEAPYKQEE